MKTSTTERSPLGSGTCSPFFSSEAPTKQGWYLMRCDEGDQKPEWVKVYEKNGHLMADIDAGGYGLDAVQGNLGNITWSTEKSLIRVALEMYPNPKFRSFRFFHKNLPIGGGMIVEGGYEVHGRRKPVTTLEAALFQVCENLRRDAKNLMKQADKWEAILLENASDVPCADAWPLNRD